MTPQEHAKILVQRIVATLHQDFGMTEGEVVKLVSEAAYEYYDQLWTLRELTEYTEELGTNPDQESPSAE